MQLQRASGILAHPTSFPSPYGIGDLGKGAYEWLEFLYGAKQSLWQILPLGPTSFGDSPYQSFSTFAGNHLLISPNILAEKGYLNTKDLSGLPEFNPGKIDYAGVISYKDKLFRKAFLSFKRNKATEFNKFCAENSAWLDDYVLFTAIKFHFIEERKYSFESPEYLEYKKANEQLLSPEQINDCFYGAVWNTWPPELINREKNAIEAWSKKLEEEIAYLKFLQFEFFEQWGQLKEEANAKGIKVIGDIPIFVAMDSADVWANKELFHLDERGYPIVVAGVPPDYFSATGQLWGNPVYDWKAHESAGYRWWISRISNMLSMVDIIRIDHFRGFDAYWAIPYGNETAVLGEWRKGPGKALFAAIEKEMGELPIIAEDLGIITDSVTELRQSLKLPGMKVLQFAFAEDGISEHLPHNFTDCNTVIYTGTHDNDTSIGWYGAATEKERDYFRRYLNVSGDDAAWDLIRMAFASCARYAVVPVQDIIGLGTEARMNIPGVASGNWQFRYTSGMLNSQIAERLAYLTLLFNRVSTEE